MAEEQENNESIPAQMGKSARQAIDGSHAESLKALANLEGKTNTVIDKGHEGISAFIGAVFEGKQKVVTGIDMAVGTVETPLLALAPTLRETASAGFEAVYGMVDGLPATALEEVGKVKGPLIEQVQAQADQVAEQATASIGALEQQIQTTRKDLIDTASTELEGLLDQVDEVKEEIVARIFEVLD